MDDHYLQTSNSQDSFLSSCSSISDNLEEFYNETDLTTQNNLKTELEERINDNIGIDTIEENIICIELNNNEKVYINYELHWTIRCV